MVMEHNDCCRFCRKNLRIAGVLLHSSSIFEKRPTLSIAERLLRAGVAVVKTSAKSDRICQRCLTLLSRLERDLPVYWRWVEDEKIEEASAVETMTGRSDKRHREPTPSKTPRSLKKFCHKPTSPGRANIRRSITKDIIKYPKQKVCEAEDALMVKHIKNKKWKAVAKVIMKHEELLQEVKVNILTVIASECKTLCDPSQNFMLWRSSPEDLSSFSISSLESDLQRLSPLLLSVFSTITNHSRPVTCAAAAIALRGRETRLSAFAHYINCILQYGGAKKAVFERLSKFAISTVHKNAIGKQKELSHKCGSGLWLLKRKNEEFLTLEAGCQSVNQGQDKTSIDHRSKSELLLSDVYRSMEDLQLSEEVAESSAMDQATPDEEVRITSDVVESSAVDQATPDEEVRITSDVVESSAMDQATPDEEVRITSDVVESSAMDQATPDEEVRITSDVVESSAVDQVAGNDDMRITSNALTGTWPTPPHTYSIIFDNLDFYMHAHHQSTLRSNQSIHWIHHIAVQDRIPIYHLTNDKPLGNLLHYDLNLSLPGEDQQMQMRREYIVLTSRILTSYLSVFKPFSNVVLRHIPHQYSAEMAQRSTDYPLGVLFKDENRTDDLAEVLKHFQNTYVPKGPDGLSTILVGGDRLSEANSRNLQWAYADGINIEERLDGMEFMFEDWHAIRVLFGIHFKVFFSEKSAKDHGTLCANMTKLRCNNAKQGPHNAYNAYKHFFITDTTALLLTAAMEHFGLQDVAEIPELFVPEEISSGSTDVRRTWLHAKSAEVVEKFILLGDVIEAMTGLCKASVTSTQTKHYPCRAQGCQQVYAYLKARDNHELTKHNLDVSSETLPENTSLTKRDHKQEHTVARLSFTFLILDMLDAVKEGDGERLMRLYKVALLYYKAYGHSHYAYSTLLMTVQVNACLTPRLSHSVIWNRFWSSKGGNGNNIPLDLHLEHLNNFLKSFLKGLGPNLSENSARRVSQSIGVLKEMMDKMDGELGVTKPTGSHRAEQQTQDVLTLTDVFKAGQLFTEIPGRAFRAYPNFDKNLLRKIKYKEMWQWMRLKITEWRKLKK